MSDWLLDTNHASKLVAGAPPITDMVRFWQSSGDRFGVSMTVVGERRAYASLFRTGHL